MNIAFAIAHKVFKISEKAVKSSTFSLRFKHKISNEFAHKNYALYNGKYYIIYVRIIEKYLYLPVYVVDSSTKMYNKNAAFPDLATELPRSKGSSGKS